MILRWLTPRYPERCCLCSGVSQPYLLMEPVLWPRTWLCDLMWEQQQQNCCSWSSEFEKSVPGIYRRLLLQIIYCCIIDCSRTHVVEDTCYYCYRLLLSSISTPRVDPFSEKKLPRNPKSEIVADSRMCFSPPVRSMRSRPGIGDERGRRWTAPFE